MTSHDEQGVIDTDAQADHRGECRSVGRHVSEGGEQGDPTEAGYQPGEGDGQWQCGRYEGTECQQQDQ